MFQGIPQMTINANNKLLVLFASLVLCPILWGCNYYNLPVPDYISRYASPVAIYIPSTTFHIPKNRIPLPVPHF